MYLNQPKPRAVGTRRNSKLLGHSQVAKAACFGTKPAGIMNVIGKDLSLQLFALAIAKQDVELSWHVDTWDNAFLRCASSIGRRLKREPVIGVWAECNDVARFPDRPKKIAAKNFPGDAAGKTREVQLG